MGIDEDNGKRGKRSKSRIERKIAWVLIIGGAAIILFIALYGIINELGGMTLEKLAGIMLAGGMLILVISVVAERIRERRTDKYRDIER